MKSLVIDRIGHTAFSEIDAPKAGPEQVLLDVRHVGLCGSDLNTFRGQNPLATLPRIPGHEIGGVVKTIGAKVPAHVATGARAIVIPYTTCGTCSACLSERANACQFNETLGVQRDGGLCRQIAVHHNRLILNETLPDAHLALVEPLSVGFHAAARGRVSDSDTVLVIGGGMIGVGAILGAKAQGARVIVAEVSAAKRDALLALGVDEVINPTTQDIHAKTKALTGGQGAHVTIEAVGLPDTFRAAIDLVCFAGRVVYVGYAKSEVSYNTALFNLKELDIMGSRNAVRADFEAVIAYLETHPTQAEQLISRVFPWSQADEALGWWETHRNETFKVLIDMQEA